MVLIKFFKYLVLDFGKTRYLIDFVENINKEIKETDGPENAIVYIADYDESLMYSYGSKEEINYIFKYITPMQGAIILSCFDVQQAFHYVNIIKELGCYENFDSSRIYEIEYVGDILAMKIDNN